MEGKRIDRDCGLGTAYERYVFYQWLERIAARYEATSFLEGPVDGMAGVPGVFGLGLAQRGIAVHAAFTDAAQAELSTAIYREERAPVTTHVAAPDALDALPTADIVLSYHALSFVPDPAAYLKALARKARKALVVTVCNPDTWGVRVIRGFSKLRGMTGVDAPAIWRTETLAPLLWELGVVKEHEYFDCPWWPDLQVSPGQSLQDRLKQMLPWRRRENLEFTATDGELSKTHVYGAGRWPYFGGGGWHEELLPALLKHPAFDGGPRKVREWTSHLHGFVVDVRPRTPQAKRRIRLVGAPEAD
jgi:hypothetical protein